MNTDGREVVNLNREWTYQRGDHPGAERTDYDDSAWEHIGLPHSFSIPYFLWKDFYTGYGWYRRIVVLDKRDLRREIFLEFDGVFQVAEVYMNGHFAGTHEGGYTGFNVRLTPYVKEGKNNINKGFTSSNHFFKYGISKICGGVMWLRAAANMCSVEASTATCVW